VTERRRLVELLLPVGAKRAADVAVELVELTELSRVETRSCAVRLACPSSVWLMGALQRGPGGPWPSQNFGWVGHNAFGPTNNWPACS